MHHQDTKDTKVGQSQEAQFLTHLKLAFGVLSYGFLVS
jgi:hypothetical protein